jgi:hypothetical protein
MLPVLAGGLIMISQLKKIEIPFLNVNYALYLFYREEE